LTSIIVNGEIFAPVRRWFAVWVEENRQAGKTYSTAECIHEILTCRHCCGFWAGLFCGAILMNYGTFADAPLSFLLTLLCCGFAGSILSLGVLLLVDFLHVHTVRFQDNQGHTHTHDEE